MHIFTGGLSGMRSNAALLFAVGVGVAVQVLQSQVDLHCRINKPAESGPTAADPNTLPSPVSVCSVQQRCRIASAAHYAS